MKKFILSKHFSVGVGGITTINSWCQFLKQHWEKSKKRIGGGYGAITNHIGNNTPYKKENARQKHFMEDLGSSILIGVNNAPLGDYF